MGALSFSFLFVSHWSIDLDYFLVRDKQGILAGSFFMILHIYLAYSISIPCVLRVDHRLKIQGNFFIPQLIIKQPKLCQKIPGSVRIGLAINENHTFPYGILVCPDRLRDNWGPVLHGTDLAALSRFNLSHIQGRTFTRLNWISSTSMGKNLPILSGPKCRICPTRIIPLTTVPPRTFCSLFIS